MKRANHRHFILLSFLIGLMPGGYAYTPPPLPDLAPEDCPAWQRSEDVTMGAWPHLGTDAIRKLFDTKELYKSGIVPILLIIRNDHPSAISLGYRGAVVLDALGLRNPALPYPNVVAALLQKREIRSVSSGPVADLSNLRTGKTADLIQDFRNKSLDQERIPPKTTLRKVLFFRLGTDSAALDGALLYFGEVYNEDTGEELIFFEFELKLPPPEE
ncbi:MAG: hypothetical protein JXQ27_16520 [Acidobacteria bacterium]|nr:hypothetical protein [Acidobacteriota bacterium]